MIESLSTLHPNTKHQRKRPTASPRARRQARNIEPFRISKGRGIDVFGNFAAEMAKQLLTHGCKADIATRHHTRDVQKYVNTTAVLLGEHTAVPNIDREIYNSAIISFASPAVGAFALQQQR